MAQETEAIEQATEDVTTTEDLTQPQDNLAPESEGQETPSQNDQDQKPEGEQPPAPSFDPEAEQLIEFNGKTYTLKGKELQTLLESQNAIAEREKALNRDYTQKTQALARERKSIESAFGRMPEPEEFQALGKVYQAYLSDPRAQQIIDSILEGNLDLSQAQSTPGKGQQSPEVVGLQREIHALKNQLSQFVSGSEREKQEAAYNEGKRIFDTWREAKQKQGTNVSEEIIDAVLETANVLKRRNPNWDAHKALDEALRRESIDQIEKTAIQKVISKADNAKKMSAIKITPKSPAKGSADMSYSEIFRTAM